MVVDASHPVRSYIGYHFPCALEADSVTSTDRGTGQESLLQVARQKDSLTQEMCGRSAKHACIDRFWGLASGGGKKTRFA